MLGFLKKLFGVKTEETVSAPYKIEAVNPQCSDSVTQPDGNECKTFPTAVNSQITDSVTQTAPVAKTKKTAPKKKPVQAKQPVQKPAAPKQGGNRGRKPKQAK
jgi:hypothetical protein